MAAVIKNYKIIPLIAVFLTAIMGVILNCNKSAYADATGGTAPTGGTAVGCSTGICYNYGLGAAWTREPVNGNDDIVWYGDGDVGTVHITGCASIGAPYYLHLAPAYFSGSVFYRQFGGIRNNQLLDWHASPGWTYNTSIPGALQLGDVKTAFDIAAQEDDDGSDSTIRGYDWDNISWFCDFTDIRKKPDERNTSFRSKSGVNISDKYITPGLYEFSDWDKKITAHFSTDDTEVKVKFEHIVGYNPGSFRMEPNDEVVGDTVSTIWEVIDEKDAYSVGKTNLGTWAPDQENEENLGSAAGEVTIRFAEDEYTDKTVCSKIQYRKSVTLNGTKKTKTVGGARIEYTEWEASYSDDTGSSTACITVTRPEPPQGNPGRPNGPSDPDTPDTEESLNDKIVFTGEEDTLYWNVRASGVSTRRLSKWNAVIFQVNHVPSPAEGKEKVSLNPNSKDDPCAMYIGRFGENLWTYGDKQCYIYKKGWWNTEEEKEVDHEFGPGVDDASFDAKIPDYVGHKYCNSFGYALEYWYSVKRTGKPIVWTHDGARDYWYNFTANCRTVAKKPSVAVWNGSSMTTGAYTTSLAPRHQHFALGAAADNNDKKLYGSWSEYLTIAGEKLDKTKTLASGSTLAIGSHDTDPLRLLCNGDKPWLGNSPLTITNTNCDQLGISGIALNSTFRTRLDAYLKNGDESKDRGQIKTVSSVSEMATVNGNMVYSTNSDLTIANDIKINDSTDYQISSVPQAVIFVDGNVNIKENVKRIDAWIIATGTVNTCDMNSLNRIFRPGNLDNDDKAIVTSDGFEFQGSHCNNQLIFNGPVIANKINLQRNYGSDPKMSSYDRYAFDNQNPSERYTAAEVFNLRADTYLWAYAQSTRYGSSYSEAYSRELAPRY